MKKAAKPSTNAIQGAAERMTRGAQHADDDLWKDEPDQSTDKPAEASDDTHTVVRQRRRPRGRKAE
jgi:hypothetical protein